MKHNYTVLLFVLMLCVFAFSVVFPLAGKRLKKSGGTEKKEYLIGISQANLLEQWRITMNREIEEEAAKHSDLRCIFTDAAMNTDRQLEDIRMLMGYAIDLLIVSPNDSDVLRPYISDIHKKIPVIVLDRDIVGEDYSLYIGPDNYRIGKTAGEYVIGLLGEKGGNIIEVCGRPDSPSAKERSQGFYDALNGTDNCRIVCRLTANWMQDQAEDRMKEYLSVTDTNIDVVFAQNDAMAYGAYSAMQKMRTAPALCVGVDGLDGPKGGKKMVEEGILSATLICPTGGRQAIEYALRMLRGEKKFPHSIILSPSLIVNKS
ncbi:substrate-binding domain-containing protein [Treponema maltophilum]|uniref:substrate-binding domain-containing protein n=1 Tax=Treponema maltophilum TaxID=51160 RepID=UPI003D939164